MSELTKAVAAFSEKMTDGLKNIRFFIMPGANVTPEELAAEINRIDDSVAGGLSAQTLDPDDGLPEKVKLQSLLEHLESQHPR